MQSLSSRCVCVRYCMYIYTVDFWRDTVNIKRIIFLFVGIFLEKQLHQFFTTCVLCGCDDMVFLRCPHNTTWHSCFHFAYPLCAFRPPTLRQKKLFFFLSFFFFIGAFIKIENNQFLAKFCISFGFSICFIAPFVNSISFQCAIFTIYGCLVCLNGINVNEVGDKWKSGCPQHKKKKKSNNLFQYRGFAHFAGRIANKGNQRAIATAKKNEREKKMPWKDQSSICIHYANVCY